METWHYVGIALAAFSVEVAALALACTRKSKLLDRAAELTLAGVILALPAMVIFLLGGM